MDCSGLSSEHCWSTRPTGRPVLRPNRIPVDKETSVAQARENEVGTTSLDVSLTTNRDRFPHERKDAFPILGSLRLLGIPYVCRILTCRGEESNMTVSTYLFSDIEVGNRKKKMIAAEDTLRVINIALFT